MTTNINIEVNRVPNTTITNGVLTTGEFVIENNLPIPASKKGRGTLPMYPFSKMGVGQSFALPKGKSAVAAVNAAHKHGKKYKQAFVSRSVGDEIRIWRVA